MIISPVIVPVLTTYVAPTAVAKREVLSCVRFTTEAKHETSKPDRGLLTRKMEVLNQNDVVVQIGYADLLVRRKPDSSPA